MQIEMTSGLLGVSQGSSALSSRKMSVVVVIDYGWPALKNR